MKFSRSVAVASLVAFSLVATGVNSSIAAPFTRLPVSSLAPVVDDQSMVVEVRRDRRGHRRYNRSRHHRKYRGHRRYNRSRHHRRYRGHRHHYGDILYSIPFWIGPVITKPRRYNRCDRWSRMCYRNWGPGSNYYGCMRYHRCR